MGPGKVAAATSECIVVTSDGELPCSDDAFLRNPAGAVSSNPDKGTYVYPLRKFMRSNSGSCNEPEAAACAAANALKRGKSSPTVPHRPG